MTAKTFIYGVFGKINHGHLKRYGSIIQRLIFCSLACCLLAGCRSTKSITYFQPVTPYMDEVVTRMMDVYMPVIKPGDILSIVVHGLDTQDRDMFNPFTTTSQYTQGGGYVVLQPIRGFTVDELGYIEYPHIGKLEVSGLTTNELSKKLTELLREFFISPTVSVNIGNFVISVLGEVVRPALYVVSNNQITLPQALALAGDLTIFGRRDNVLLIRETDGDRHFARIDLTGRDLFESPYYFLHDGDVLYVEATTGKLTSTDRAYQLAPVLISTLSFLMLLFNFISNNVTK